MQISHDFALFFAALTAYANIVSLEVKSKKNANIVWFPRITGTGQLIRWIKCPRPWDKVDDTFLKKWSYSWFCWLGYFSWRFDGFSCNSLIFSKRRNRHSWYLTVLNRQTVKPSCHFSKSGSAEGAIPMGWTSREILVLWRRITAEPLCYGFKQPIGTTYTPSSRRYA